MHCDHAFYVGGTHENADILGELERLPGCCGVKVFMGASTGIAAGADDAGVGDDPRAHPPARRLPLRGRIPPRRAPAAGAHRRLVQPSARCATPRRADPLARGGCSPRRGAGKRVHVLHVTTAEEMDFLAEHKDVATRRGHAPAPDPRRAGGLRAPRGPRADEPADPRRRAPRGAVARRSPRASSTCRHRPRAAHAGGEGAALSGLALGHARRPDPGADHADPRRRGPAHPRALRRSDQRRAAAPLRPGRQGPHRASATTPTSPSST